MACLPDGAYREERKAFFGSIHRTLNHLLVVDRLWTGRIRGTELVDGLSAPQLAAPVRYRRIIGEGLEEVRAGHVLLTLFNHQTHHRGQVHVLLTQADVTPPPLDVLFFLEEIGAAGPPGTLAPVPEAHIALRSGRA